MNDMKDTKKTYGAASIKVLEDRKVCIIWFMKWSITASTRLWPDSVIR